MEEGELYKIEFLLFLKPQTGDLKLHGYGSSKTTSFCRVYVDTGILGEI